MNQAESARSCVLLLKVPRTNDKKELAAEQLFASLHGLLTNQKSGWFAKSERQHLSFEIAVLDRQIGFYIWVPAYLKSYVEEQVYAQYPSVQISEVPDYLASGQFATNARSRVKLQTTDVLPILTFPSFEVDPLAAMTATLAKFTADERAVIQFLVRPAPRAWDQRAPKYAQRLHNPGPSFSQLLQGKATAAPAPLSDLQRSRLQAAETKGQKLLYETKIRVMYQGPSSTAEASMRLQAILASFKQFNSTTLNGFVAGKTEFLASGQALASRAFGGSGLMTNIEELASLYHLPHTNVETPFILWATARTGEPPANLPVVTNDYDPTMVSPVALTNFRGHNTGFGLPRSDRGRHLYIIGQTGVGKSAMLELLTISDIYSGDGFAVIDPHGDYAVNILQRIPPERIKDVVYFNPADTDFPVAFNPMEVYDPALKSHISSELIGVLKRMFESWGPRLEYILRYSILALLDYPDATMLDITRLLTDKNFRRDVLAYVKDPVVKNFWLIEFASWNDKFAAEAVAPVLNKVGAFTANPMVRNIIGQPKSSFNIRQIMDERKILVVNLSRGLIGEDNAALLGALLVTKIQIAAMSRANIAVAQRTPFYLYVDEFQNFATDSFATILSEARKYGLCLTVANQYIAQMSPSVRDAVFGNVGSIIAFRMGVDDARQMQRYFEPKFEEHDLVHAHNRNFVISMTIGGEKVQAFSGTTLNLPAQPAHHMTSIIDLSHRLHASQRDQVEVFVKDRYLDPAAVPKTAAQNSTPTTPKRKRQRRRKLARQPFGETTIYLR